MNKATVLTLLCSVVVGVATAQEGYSKRIEVTREYTPKLLKADRLSIAPEMSDTTTLRPEIDYSIQPAAFDDNYTVTPLEAVRLSTAEWQPTTPFYAKLALGYPLQSAADFYFTPVITNKATVGAFVNHNGLWADIENDAKYKGSALGTDNRAGIYALLNLSKSIDLGINVDYKGSINTPYGGDYTPDSEYDFYHNRIAANNIGGRIAIGSKFADNEKFNFRAAIDAGCYWRSFKGAENSGQNNIAFMGEAAKGWDIHTIGVRLLFDGHYGTGSLGKAIDDQNHRYATSLITLAPYYRLVADNGFTFDLGVDYIAEREQMTAKTSSHIMPNITVAYDARYELIPYASLKGSVTDGSMQSWADLSPYIARDVWTTNGTVLDSRAGLYGEVGSVKYDCWVSLKHYSNYHQIACTMLAPDLNSNIFTPVLQNMNLFGIGGRIDWKIAKGLILNAEGEYRMPKITSADYGIDQDTGIYRFDLKAGLNYALKDRWFFALNFKMRGKATYALLGSDNATFAPASEYVSVPTQHNLHFGVGYRLTKKIYIGIDGNNLTNNHNYLCPLYPDLGLNVMGNVRINF